MQTARQVCNGHAQQFLADQLSQQLPYLKQWGTGEDGNRFGVKPVPITAAQPTIARIGVVDRVARSADTDSGIVHLTSAGVPPIQVATPALRATWPSSTSIAAICSTNSGLPPATSTMRHRTALGEAEGLSRRQLISVFLLPDEGLDLSSAKIQEQRREQRLDGVLRFGDELAVVIESKIVG